MILIPAPVCFVVFCRVTCLCLNQPFHLRVQEQVECRMCNCVEEQSWGRFLALGVHAELRLGRCA